MCIILLQVNEQISIWGILLYIKNDDKIVYWNETVA